MNKLKQFGHVFKILTKEVVGDFFSSYLNNASHRRFCTCAACKEKRKIIEKL